MLHNTIKELARRSMSHDRVMFGESNKQHPLGFDGFMVDATVDRALLQLNSSTYDSATSLGVECDNLSRLLRESMSVNVNSSVGKLYRESKVGEIFKKVIAYIKKALKFLFVELPKKVYNKIKSFFTKKKDSAGMAKKTEENIKKTEESLKTVQKEMKDKMSNPEFEAWRKEMLSELDGVKKGIDATSDAEAERATDDVLKAAKQGRAERDANMKVVSDDGFDSLENTKANVGKNITDRHSSANEHMKKSLDAIHANLDSVEEFNDKTNKVIKKAGKSYANARDTGATEFTDTLKEIDAIGAELDDLLTSMDATPGHNDVTTMKYREAELKMMADTLLSSIESGKVKLRPLLRKDMRYFADVFLPWTAEDNAANGAIDVSAHFQVFAMNVMLRSVDAIPYTTPTLAKYFKDKYKVEMFNAFSTGDIASKPSSAVAVMLEQLKSVNKLCDSLNISRMPKFDIEIFNDKFIDSLVRSMRRQDATKHRISLDALESISSKMTTNHENADVNTLKTLEKPYGELEDAVKNMNESIKFIKNMTTGDVAEYIGVDPDNDTAIHEGAQNILALIREVTDITQKITVSAMRCIFSMSSAEEKIVKAVVSSDDYVSSITMTQLAHFMANDMPSLRRAWKILHGN